MELDGVDGVVEFAFGEDVAFFEFEGGGHGGRIAGGGGDGEKNELATDGARMRNKE
jgi:hypothetical protein